ncbi:MAG: GNAT family N-acetyltransferase [Actinomycetota bacterium]
MISYERASREDLAAVADFFASLNVQASHRIGYFGDSPAEISRELLEYGAIDHSFVARQDGVLVGFMAMDIDEELDRSYLYGPLVAREPWGEVAHRLVERCLDLIPDGATGRLEMFFDRGNANLARLGRALGFETYKDVRTLRFDRAGLDALGAGGASPVDGRHHEGVVALHDRLFPNTYLPGQRMLEGLSTSR